MGVIFDAAEVSRRLRSCDYQDREVTSPERRAELARNAEEVEEDAEYDRCASVAETTAADAMDPERLKRRQLYTTIMEGKRQDRFCECCGRRIDLGPQIKHRRALSEPPQFTEQRKLETEVDYELWTASLLAFIQKMNVYAHNEFERVLSHDYRAQPLSPATVANRAARLDNWFVGPTESRYPLWDAQNERLVLNDVASREYRNLPPYQIADQSERAQIELFESQTEVRRKLRLATTPYRKRPSQDVAPQQVAPQPEGPAESAQSHGLNDAEQTTATQELVGHPPGDSMSQLARVLAPVSVSASAPEPAVCAAADAATVTDLATGPVPEFEAGPSAQPPPLPTVKPKAKSRAKRQTLLMDEQPPQRRYPLRATNARAAREHVEMKPKVGGKRQNTDMGAAPEDSGTAKRRRR